MTKTNSWFLKMRRASDYNRIILTYCSFGLLMGLLQIVLTG